LVVRASSIKIDFEMRSQLHLVSQGWLSTTSSARLAGLWTPRHLSRGVDPGPFGCQNGAALGVRQEHGGAFG
jgi:hypothetical protein